MKKVEFERLPYSVQAEIASILFERIPELAHYWSWEYVLQTLIDLPDPIMLQRGTVGLREIKGCEFRANGSIAVKKYAHMTRSGLEPPPILVEDRELLDGWHRCMALATCGRLQVDAVDIKPLLEMDWESWQHGNIPPNAPVRSHILNVIHAL